MEYTIPTTPTPQYPEYTNNVLNTPPSYGVLEDTIGTWVNVPNDNKINLGLHTNCMPSPGTNTETIFGVFHLLCENYVKELTFSAVKDFVRNRGGTNERFSGGSAAIMSPPDGSQRIPINLGME